MILNRDTRILIVGLGLIGGSYAESLSSSGYRVDAIDRDPAAISLALKRGYIGRGWSDALSAPIEEYDLIVLALYPHALTEWLKEHAHRIATGAVVTDVTGVKGCVARTAQELLGERAEYISAHPMAGKEVSGVANADGNIFRGANYIIVPTERNTPEGIATCRALAETLGFGSIHELDVESHDSTVGYLSHLTHCIAVALMTARDTADLADYSGDSFLDLTRIATINDELWSELFLSNKTALLNEMELFEKGFDRLKQRIASGDREGIREILRQSTINRRAFEHREK